MPPTRRQPAPNRAARRATTLPRKTGTFARLKAEAAAGSPQVEPYLIEDVDPVISIGAPETAEQQLALGELFGEEGQFHIKDARRILESICGDSFPAVWELFRKENIHVLVALIQDMGRHFEEQGALDNDVDEDDFPGGSPASST